MSLANPYVQYQQNAVQTAAPGELTLMLYNGLVRFNKQAINALRQEDLHSSNEALLRSQEIVSYLNETLDPNYELSQHLSALYVFMNEQLIQANIKKEPQIVEDVLGLAEELRDTWQQAISISRENGY